MAEKKNAVLVLFAGQSNMQGQTEMLLDDSVVENAFEYRLFGDAFVPLRDPVGENVCYDGTQGAAFREGDDQQAWLDRHALGSACYGNSSMVPAFCRAYGTAAGCTVLAVHTAKGSTQAADWLPGTGGHAILVKKAKAALARAQQTYAVQSVNLVWLQGESDAIAGVTKQAYKDQLTALNDSLRKELGLKCFGIIRVGSFTGTPRDEVIQTAQEELCAETPGFAMLTRLTTELERSPEWMNPFVTGHFGAKGLAKLGEAAGKALAQQGQNV